MVICSRCGQEGHNRRSATCPGVAVAADALPVEAPQQQQPRQYQGTLYPFIYCQETFVELNADLYDRVLIHKSHFTREFLSDHTDEQGATDDNKVFLASIANPLSGKSIVVNVGGPHREYDTEAIYAPTWILQALNIIEASHILWQRLTPPPPRATKISLRPIDTLINVIDGRAEIEEHLKNFNVLQEGTEIQIPLRPLGNTLVTIYVEKTEPAQVVLLRDEVELDLLESVLGAEEVGAPLPLLWDPSQPSGRPPTPIPETPTMLIPSVFPQGSELYSNILHESSNTPQQPDRQTRRQMMAMAAERRRLAAQELDTSNGGSNEQ